MYTRTRLIIIITSTHYQHEKEVEEENYERMVMDVNIISYR